MADSFDSRINRTYHIENGSACTHTQLPLASIYL